jgi:ABC-type dipeptide/oligopeptide/nickel transport system permease subunit
MKIRNLALLAFTLVTGSTLGALIGGGFIHTIIARFFCLWIGLPALIMLVVSGFPLRI